MIYDIFLPFRVFCLFSRAGVRANFFNCAYCCNPRILPTVLQYSSPPKAHPPSPLLLRLLGCQSPVLGLGGEVVPAVYRESLEGPIGTLGEDVVGGVLRHPPFLLALEPSRMAQTNKVLRISSNIQHVVLALATNVAKAGQTLTLSVN